MKILTAAYYEFLKYIRDVRMSLVFLFPILTIYILGNAVSGFFTQDIIDRIPIGYVNQDRGIIGKEFDKFLENKEIKAWLEIKVFDERERAEKAVEQGEIDGLIYLPQSLSEEISKGNPQLIILEGKENIEFVESLTSGFVSSFNSLSAVIAISGNPSLPDRERSIERIFFTKDASVPSMIDYYSVLTLLQMLIIGGIFGIFIISKNPNSDMHIRIHSLPISKWTLLGGRVLGSVAYLFLASIIVIAFTKYVYNANWDGNFLIILGTMLVFSAITVGIGILVGIFVPNISAGLMVVLLIMMFFGTISGAVSPATTGDFGIISPNFHAKILIFGTIYGYSKEVMLESVLWLGAFIIVIYGLSAVLIGGTKNDNI